MYCVLVTTNIQTLERALISGVTWESVPDDVQVFH